MDLKIISLSALRFLGLTDYWIRYTSWKMKMIKNPGILHFPVYTFLNLQGFSLTRIKTVIIV